METKKSKNLSTCFLESEHQLRRSLNRILLTLKRLICSEKHFLRIVTSELLLRQVGANEVSDDFATGFLSVRV